VETTLGIAVVVAEAAVASAIVSALAKSAVVAKRSPGTGASAFRTHLQ
jgi:hypothetical protein